MITGHILPGNEDPSATRRAKMFSSLAIGGTLSAVAVIASIQGAIGLSELVVLVGLGALQLYQAWAAYKQS
jgi:hypothetical protein